mgnify:CR=1 FL=1
MRKGFHKLKRQTTGTLTPRERQIALLIGKTGMSYKEAGQHLNIATKTVDVHMRNIRAKLHINSVYQLIRLVLSGGLACLCLMLQGQGLIMATRDKDAITVSVLTVGTNVCLETSTNGINWQPMEALLFYPGFDINTNHLTVWDKGTRLFRVTP